MPFIAHLVNHMRPFLRWVRDNIYMNSLVKRSTTVKCHLVTLYNINVKLYCDMLDCCLVTFCVSEY
jgi:hypothetical protein